MLDYRAHNGTKCSVRHQSVSTPTTVNHMFDIVVNTPVKEIMFYEIIIIIFFLIRLWARKIIKVFALLAGWEC